MIIASLLPETLFTNSTSWLLWVMAAGAVPLLAFGADRLVEAAVKIAKAAGLPTVIIGATIVSLGTTTPEAVVSVRAAIGGSPDMALGNAVGSVICDTALIFGLCCLLTQIPLDRKILDRHGWIQLGSGIVLCLTAIGAWLFAGNIENAHIGRGIGLAYLCLLAGYMWLSIKWAKQDPSSSIMEVEHDDKDKPAQKAEEKSKTNIVSLILANLAVLVFGIALVVLGSEFLIGSASEICMRNNVPKAVIAVTLVALGTSLPELVTALASVYKGHAELMVGNIIGADILNVLFVVGASATATPLKVEPVFFKLLLPTMLLVLVLLRIFIFTGGKSFKRWHGIPLLGIYIVFITLSVAVFGISH